MKKKIRLYYWLIKGFVFKHTKLLIIAIIFGALFSLIVPKYFIYLPRPRLYEKIAVIGKPTLQEIPLFIQKEISIGLTDITLSGEATPSAAVSFTQNVDAKKFTFKLRDDLYWHDGKKFTVEDINYNFSDVQVEIISANEVVFNLQDSFSPFPTIVSQPLFRQKKSFPFLNNFSLLGLGNMKVKKIVKKGNHVKEILLVSNNLKKHYKFYNTQESAILAFKLGEVDQILDLASPGEISEWPNVKVFDVVHPEIYVAVFFNINDPLLSSKSFRQALTYAISEKKDVKKRALSPISPNSWAYNPQVKAYDYNLDNARLLLDKEKEENPNFDPKIELTTTLPYLNAAENIKNQWNELDIPTTVKVVSYLPDAYQALLIAQEIPPDPDQYSLWHSTQNTNITNYNSPKIDKLLEDGRQILDKKERTLIYQDFQRFLVEDTPAAFLYFHNTYNIERD